MKRVNIIFATILLVVMTGCGGGKQSTGETITVDVTKSNPGKESILQDFDITESNPGKDSVLQDFMDIEHIALETNDGLITHEIITVDVTKSYPQKKYVLQDFMDVEYVALETNDDFITQGVIQSVGKEIMVAKNRFHDGDIFIYDRNGKGLRKINRSGQGGEEYVRNYEIVLDEDNNELFISDRSSNKILVYDLYGIFKRSFKYIENRLCISFYDYDRNNLICYDGNSYTGMAQVNDPGAETFFILSKQDGSIVKKIEFPYKQKKTPLYLDLEKGVIDAPIHYPIIPHRGNHILFSRSTDTVYCYSPGHTITPIITRIPSIQSMDPEVFLFPGIFTGRYYYMESVRKELNYETRKFPTKGLMYDRLEKSIYEATIYNSDYSGQTVSPFMKTDALWPSQSNDEIAFYIPLEPYQLVEAYEQGKLSGKLKDIAAKLDAEDNPVIMLVKYKK